MKELIALAKAKPGQLSYASPGAGTTGHLAAELFKRMAGVDYVIVPYKGGGPAMLANLSGECQFSFATALSVAGYIKSGKLRALAVTTAKRSPNFPDLPTVAEAGVPGFDAITWHGIVVPARTPQPAIARLNGELNKLLQTADMRERLAALGSDVDRRRAEGADRLHAGRDPAVGEGHQGIGSEGGVVSRWVRRPPVAPVRRARECPRRRCA